MSSTLLDRLAEKPQVELCLPCLRIVGGGRCARSICLANVAPKRRRGERDSLAAEFEEISDRTRAELRALRGEISRDG
jgi:hypothetical protein